MVIRSMLRGLLACAFVLAPGVALAAEAPETAALPVAKQAAPQAPGKRVGKWDTNRDGRIDKAEKEHLQKTLLERWDADGDGRLSVAERDAAREAGDLPQRSKARKKAEALRRKAAQQQARIEKYDTDGDGELSEQEIIEGIEKPRAERAALQRKKNLERYDENGDGVLDEDERLKARRENGLIRRDEVEAILRARDEARGPG